jgi:hypothetical protein
MPVAIGGGMAAGATASGARGSSAVAPIVINYAPQMTVAAGTPTETRKAIFDALEENRYRLVQLIQRELANRSRGEF